MNSAALYRLLGPASRRESADQRQPPDPQEDTAQRKSCRPGYGQLLFVASRATEPRGEVQSLQAQGLGKENAVGSKDAEARPLVHHSCSLADGVADSASPGNGEEANKTTRHHSPSLDHVGLSKDRRRQGPEQDVLLATPHRMPLTPMNPSANLAATPISVAMSAHRQKPSGVGELLTPLSAMAISEPPSSSRQQNSPASGMLFTPQSAMVEKLKPGPGSPAGSSAPETPGPLLQPCWDMPEKREHEVTRSGRQQSGVQLWYSEPLLASGSVSECSRGDNDSFSDMDVACGQTSMQSSAERRASPANFECESDREPDTDFPLCRELTGSPGLLQSRDGAGEAHGLVFQNWTQLELEESDTSSSAGGHLSSPSSDLQSNPVNSPPTGYAVPKQQAYCAPPESRDTHAGQPQYWAPKSGSPVVVPDTQPAESLTVVPKSSGENGQDVPGACQLSNSRLQGCTSFWRQQDAFDFADRYNAALATGQGSQQGNSIDTVSWQAEPNNARQNSSVDAVDSRTAADMHTACCSGAVQVFCSETPRSKGGYSRQFMAGTLEALWHHHSNTAPQERHLYEVIRANQPCKLYCDLEYYKAYNPKLDGEQMVDTLVGLLTAEILSRWGIHVSPEDDVLEFDSSTNSKFSRHLIVNVPGAAFCNNALVGAIVGQCMGDARLQVQKEGAENPCTSLVDMAVYTRNRHFRIYLSSKSNKHARLLPTERYSAWRYSTSKALMIASLAGNVPPDAKVLDSSELHCQQHAGGHFVRLDSQNQTYGTPCVSLPSSQGLNGHGKHLKTFIEEIAKARSGGLPVAVRTLAASPDGGTLLLSTVGPGSHYCENVERLHKSNHVFFVVDLAQGIYAQKCYDPDCRHYRSLWLPVPKHLLDSLTTDR